jgi:hypothetical protein
VPCSQFAGKGESCGADPPFFSAFVPRTMCSPGLSCRGLAYDGGLGTCEESQDIGGPCVTEAASTGCKLGLNCQCGTCQIPPSSGTCERGPSPCQVGVAFCYAGTTCLPVQGKGGPCKIGTQPYPEACGPELWCDSETCEP